MVDTRALKPLEALVGRWQTTGETIAEPPEPSIAISGTDVYEWFDNVFLLHHADVQMGPQRMRVLEMIGEHDPSDDSYAMRSFDSSGTFTTMRASVDDEGVWTFANDDMRVRLAIGEDGRSMAARWERRTDDTMWRHWMDMQFTRLPDAG
ncbi:DUF1579 family protein [Micromonospora sp. NPDC007230]|uniref:DUF1579 family protein n=1 Tax=Micromonospora sp. NPDC007230 TaxID=3364237 RepID=UPI0036CDAE8E